MQGTSDDRAGRMMRITEGKGGMDRSWMMCITESLKEKGGGGVSYMACDHVTGNVVPGLQLLGWKRRPQAAIGYGIAVDS